MNNFVLLGETANPANQPAANGSWIVTIGYVVILGLMLYFILIRPQKKQQKKLNAMLSTLEAGDSVITASGFYGVVIDVMDEVVIVEFGNNKNCRIPMKKSAIVELEKANTDKSDKNDK